MASLNIGFIGAGGIAGRHVNDLLGFPDVRIAAFADTALERAQGSAERTGGTAYSDYRQMLDHEKLDAVYVCVPPFAHGDLELALIERGLPFFVEKPLALDMPTAQRIADGVAAKKLITAVGYHWRYLDTTDEARDLLANNPARLALGYWLDSTPPPGWWRHDDQSGGQMIEQTTHIFDLARVLVGDVNRVYAAGAQVAHERPDFPGFDTFDVTTATLHFASGALGNMTSTCLLNWSHRVGLHLFSEGMVIELSGGEIMTDVGRGRPVRGAQGDPFVREDRDFIDAVLGGENRIRAPYADALKTHQVTVAATQSARENRPIDLNVMVNHV